MYVPERKRAGEKENIVSEERERERVQRTKEVIVFNLLENPAASRTGTGPKVWKWCQEQPEDDMSSRTKMQNGGRRNE